MPGVGDNGDDVSEGAGVEYSVLDEVRRMLVPLRRVGEDVDK